METGIPADVINVSWNPNSYSSTLQSAFTMMLEDKIHVDVTLVAENNARVKCHRVILAACSPLLAQLILANTSPDLVICLVGVKEWQLYALISFMYQGVVKQVSRSQFEELQEVAEHLKIHGLFENRVTELAENVTDEDENKVMSPVKRSRSSSDCADNYDKGLGEIEQVSSNKKMHLEQLVAPSLSPPPFDTNHVEAAQSSDCIPNAGLGNGKADGDMERKYSDNHSEELDKSMEILHNLSDVLTIEKRLADCNTIKQFKSNNELTTARKTTPQTADSTKKLPRGRPPKGRGKPKIETEELLGNRPLAFRVQQENKLVHHRTMSTPSSIDPIVFPRRVDQSTGSETRSTPHHFMDHQSNTRTPPVVPQSRETQIPSFQQSAVPVNDPGYLLHLLSMAGYAALFSGLSFSQVATVYGVPETMLRDFVRQYGTTLSAIYAPQFHNFQQANNHLAMTSQGMQFPGSAAPCVAGGGSSTPVEGMNTKLPADTTLIMLPK